MHFLSGGLSRHSQQNSPTCSNGGGEYGVNQTIHDDFGCHNLKKHPEYQWLSTNDSQIWLTNNVAETTTALPQSTGPGTFAFPLADGEVILAILLHRISSQLPGGAWILVISPEQGAVLDHVNHGGGLGMNPMASQLLHGRL